MSDNPINSNTIRDIQTLEDIELLVHTFYGHIRQDALLGPIFNGHIPDEKWPEHLHTLSKFWEVNLLGDTGFRANPRAKHLGVDKNLDYDVKPAHFERWLQLWFGTIDSLFAGTIAEQAKMRAMNMANGQFAMMVRNRPGSHSII